MQSIASVPLLDDVTDDARAALLSDDTLCSLAHVFATLPDPRSRHGMRYDLPCLLTCLVGAVLCGATSTDAVGQGNTPRLHTDVVSYCSDPAGTWEEATTRDRHRGRTFAVYPRRAFALINRRFPVNR